MQKWMYAKLAQYPKNGFDLLKANAVDMVVLINKEKGEVVEIVDLPPLEINY